MLAELPGSDDCRYRSLNGTALDTGLFTGGVPPVAAVQSARAAVWRQDFGPGKGHSVKRPGKSHVGLKMKRQQKLGKRAAFRADPAFAKPEIYEKA